MEEEDWLYQTRSRRAGYGGSGWHSDAGGVDAGDALLADAAEAAATAAGKDPQHAPSALQSADETLQQQQDEVAEDEDGTAEGGADMMSCQRLVPSRGPEAEQQQDEEQAASPTAAAGVVEDEFDWDLPSATEQAPGGTSDGGLTQVRADAIKGRMQVAGCGLPHAGCTCC